MASTGVVLAVLQFVFALTWIIYVIYLPALAAQAGIPKEYVPWILLMDQAIFVACDWAAGIYADRLLGVLGRIGPRIAMVTLVSTAAFLALPWIAPMGSVALFIALTVLWSATSSALRAPPLVLLGKHAAAPQRPWLVGLYLFGVGAAGAVSPYLGSALEGDRPGRSVRALGDHGGGGDFRPHRRGERTSKARPRRCARTSGASTRCRAAPSRPSRWQSRCWPWASRCISQLNSAPAYLKFANPRTSST